MLRHLSGIAVLLAVSSPAFTEVKVGEPPPEIRLDALLPDQPVANATLHALAGKAVVLEFWATWCAPCVAAIPHLNELATQFKDRPVVFLSVSDETPSVVEAFLQKHPIDGLVGIANTTKLKQAYGVHGIPQAFLIDAQGKLAGALHPSQLTATTLENLLAGKPVPFDVFAPPDFAIKRSEDGAGPKPLLDILVRPSSSQQGSTVIGPGVVKMGGSTLSRIVSWDYGFLDSRIAGEPDILTTRYDLVVAMPGANIRGLRALVQELIPAAFHVNVKRETKDTDVFVLTAPSGKPAALVESTGAGGRGGPWEMGDGKLEMTECSMAQLTTVLESHVGRPVLDETGLSGRYDIKLKYDTSVRDGLLDALRSIGLKVDPARRPIEFLVVTKAQ